jgi:small subunit ribosomal protein S15
MTTTAAARTRIREFAANDKDTGSCQVQVAGLTERITALTEHLKTHSKDNATRRGLLQMVGKRNRLLRYLQRTDPRGYDALIDKLGIRGVRTSA